MTTDAVDFRAALGALFNDAWGNTTPIAWPGRDYTPPTDLDSWVRLTINTATNRQIEIGHAPPQFRETGLIIVQVFTKENIGDGPALTLADQVATIFRNQRVTYTNGRAILRAPQIIVLGPERGSANAGQSEAAWFQVNVTTPYLRDTLG